MIFEKSFAAVKNKAARQIAEARGWHVRILWQRPVSDGRRLKNCVIPSDPWFAYLAESADPLAAGRVAYGSGDTAEAAVLAAIPPDLRAAMRRLEAAVDSLRDCLQK